MNLTLDRDPVSLNTRPFRRWWLVAPAMLVLWIVAQIDKTNVSLIIANHSFLTDLSLSGHNMQLGALMSAFFVGYGISIFVWGYLVDRYGPRICAILGSLIWGLMLYWSSHVHSLNEFLMLRFLLGIAEGNLWPVCNALTNRWFPVREHSTVQAFWVAGSTVGTAIGIPIVSALILQSGWRGALAGLALLSLIPVFIFVFVKNRPQVRVAAESGENAGNADSTVGPGLLLPLKELVRTRKFWLLTGVQFVSCTTVYTLIQWIPSYAINARGIGLREVGPWITGGYLIATALTMVAGYIADRTMERALVGAVLCTGLVLLLLPAIFLEQPAASALFLASLICAGSGTGALNGALLHMMVRPEAIARATGVYAGIGNFSSALGPAIFGYLITWSGTYSVSFWFLAMMNAIGAILYFALFRLERRSRRSQVAQALSTAAIVLD